jgi:hypothetical protein
MKILGENINGKQETSIEVSMLGERSATWKVKLKLMSISKITYAWFNFIEVNHSCKP